MQRIFSGDSSFSFFFFLFLKKKGEWERRVIYREDFNLTVGLLCGDFNGGAGMCSGGFILNQLLTMVGFKFQI